MLEIFQYDFLIRAFIAGIITAIIAPLIGMFLVVRRYSLMADTLAHVSLVGVAIGLLTNINPVLSSLVTAVVSSIAIERLRETKKVFGESILALFLSGGLAVAVVLISLSHGFNVNLISYLFGSIVTVSMSDIYIISAISVLILGTVIVFYQELFFISFSEELAMANGLNVRFLNILLIVLAAITVSLSMRIVGVLLVGALMIIPTISAIQFRLSFRNTLFCAIAISLISVIAGLFASYYYNLASGGTIVVVALFLFGFSLLINKDK